MSKIFFIGKGANLDLFLYRTNSDGYWRSMFKSNIVTSFASLGRCLTAWYSPITCDKFSVATRECPTAIDSGESHIYVYRVDIHINSIMRAQLPEIKNRFFVRSNGEDGLYAIIPNLYMYGVFTEIRNGLTRDIDANDFLTWEKFSPQR